MWSFFWHHLMSKICCDSKCDLKSEQKLLQKIWRGWWGKDFHVAGAPEWNQPLLARGINYHLIQLPKFQLQSTTVIQDCGHSHSRLWPKSFKMRKIHMADNTPHLTCSNPVRDWTDAVSVARTQGSNSLREHIINLKTYIADFVF